MEQEAGGGLHQQKRPLRGVVLLHHGGVRLLR
jgi:hypothetical protein